MKLKKLGSSSFSYSKLIEDQKVIDINPPQHKRLFLQNRENSLATWKKYNITKGTINGKELQGPEFFRQMEKLEKERLKKDNNVIELDLLK